RRDRVLAFLKHYAVRGEGISADRSLHTVHVDRHGWIVHGAAHRDGLGGKQSQRTWRSNGQTGSLQAYAQRGSRGIAGDVRRLDGDGDRALRNHERAIEVRAGKRGWRSV